MRYRVLITLAGIAAFVTQGAAAQQADPPARVGRIAAVSGTVSFHLAGAEQWQRASLNLPLTDGAAVWTQPGAAASLGFGGISASLDATTDFELDHLDEHALAATQPVGESFWRVLALPGGDSITLVTPRGSIALEAAGRYEIASGNIERPTEITVLEGSAKVTGLPAEVDIGPNQTLTITGDGAATPFAPTLHSASHDPFLQRMLSAERPPPTRHVALPPAVALMTGAEVLAEEGDWAESGEYGPVWYPPAASGFVPYRNGHWAYVAPWGWTWVDDAPWGFAPSHYGRWAEIDGRWGWVPGREWAPERPPVYAPALVAFIGGAAAGSWVGWAPLGPRDVYRPAYNVSPRYAEAFNRPTGAVTNITNINTFNRQAITVVPAQAMASSVNVAQAFRAAPPPAAFATQPVQFRAPVAPTVATVGATAAVLHGVAPPQAGLPLRQAGPGPAFEHAAPGPAIIEHAGPGPAIVPGGRVGAPLLRPAPPPGGLPELRPNGVIRSAVPGAPFVPPPSGPLAPRAPEPPAAPRPQAVTPQPPAPTPQRAVQEPPAARPAELARPMPPQRAIQEPPPARPAELARPVPPQPAPRPQPAPLAAARPEPPHREQPRPPPPRVEPPRPMPQAQIRPPAPAAFHPPPPRPAPPSRPPPARPHEEERRHP